MVAAGLASSRVALADFLLSMRFYASVMFAMF